MKISQVVLREQCIHLTTADDSWVGASVDYGNISIRPAHKPTGVSLGNLRVVVYKDNEMIARGRFNDLSKFILHEIKAQP